MEFSTVEAEAGRLPVGADVPQAPAAMPPERDDATAPVEPGVAPEPAAGAGVPESDPETIAPAEVVGPPESELEADRPLRGHPPAEPPATLELEELAQELRRVGREVFRANRAAERNQELFESALAELRQLGAVVARTAEQGEEVVFAAKATLCRELLDVVDTLEASLAASTEAMGSLQRQARPDAGGFGAGVPAARQLRSALGASVATMRQWHEGQDLLRQRLLRALHAGGLRQMETAGRQFDPALHHVTGTQARRGSADGTILVEERTGYLLDGRVLRYAEVVVARGGEPGR